MLPLASKSQTGEIKLILASGSARRKLLLETLVNYKKMRELRIISSIFL
jgi:hypothetical protein